MDDGTYRKINFNLFNVNKFVPHLFASPVNMGCGATALSLLTGANPDSLPKKEHWPTRYMLEFLRKRGFKTAKLTKRSITNCIYPSYPLTRRHVLLLSVKYIKNLGSWIVIYDERIYHNFDIIKLQGLELLNHPVSEAFLIVHPSWQKTDDEDKIKISSISIDQAGAELRAISRARQAGEHREREIIHELFPKYKKEQEQKQKVKIEIFHV